MKGHAMKEWASPEMNGEEDRGQNLPTNIKTKTVGPTIEESVISLPSSAEVISPSMTLTDDCARNLFEVLGALKEKAKTGDREAISDACDLAKEITNLMRLKLDTIKFFGLKK